MDFRNTAEEIRKAFEPYYGQTEATPSDPNVLFDAADAVRAFDVITNRELAQFTQAWAALHEVDEDRQHAVLSTSTQSAYDTARALDGDTLQELRDSLNRFTRFYGFLSQALPTFRPTPRCSTSSARSCCDDCRATSHKAASTSPARSC